MLTISLSHVWLFDGAENGKWLQDLRRELGKQEQETTRVSTCLPSAGGDISNYRKRDYLEVNDGEPAMKKVKSEQNLASSSDDIG